MASASAIVSASGWKKAPATPVSRAKGRKITIVERLDPISGRQDGAQSRDRRRRRALLAVALDALRHDDGVVGDQPERGGDAAQGHEVDRLARDAEGEQDHGDRERDRRDGDERDADAAQEDEQHQAPPARRR